MAQTEGSVRCALVPPASAEAARRALDRAGALDTSVRAFRDAESGCVALPLTDGAADGTSLECEGSPLRVALAERPAGGERGQRAQLRAAVRRALADAPEAAEAAALVTADEALPQRWEKLGDVVLLAPRGFADEASPAGAALLRLPHELQLALWAALASALGARRLGVQGRVADAALRAGEAEEALHRKSGARLVWPPGCDDGWTVQRENGIAYGLDVTRSMFSSGNGTEKARVGGFRCEGETVVDLYAGIGYFTLPYLVHAKAARLHACEWDDDALVALRRNLAANGVADRCTVHPGDNVASLAAFAGSAHRVNLGLIPTSEAAWPTAVAALRPEGGWLHVHANVSSDEAEEAAWAERLLARLRAIADAAGREGWVAVLEHLERVKWYAPKVRHVVADVRLGPP